MVIVDGCVASPCAEYSPWVPFWNGESRTLNLPMVQFIDTDEMIHVKRDAWIILNDDGSWHVNMNGIRVMEGSCK